MRLTRWLGHPARVVPSVYLLAIVLGTGLLMLPAATTTGESAPLLARLVHRRVGDLHHRADHRGHRHLLEPVRAVHHHGTHPGGWLRHRYAGEPAHAARHWADLPAGVTAGRSGTPHGVRWGSAHPEDDRRRDADGRGRHRRGAHRLASVPTPRAGPRLPGRASSTPSRRSTTPASPSTATT